jgi:hypothetical protein
MGWSLDWFAAKASALGGAHIRRVAWTTQFLTAKSGIWYLTASGVQRVVQAGDFTASEFNARDWTDQPAGADVCGATPAYNTAAVVYGSWTPVPVFTPPPPPGFPSS